MEKSYKTIEKEAQDEFVEQRSRFIGYVRPVTDEQQALDFIEEKKKQHWDAKHNVYAYIIREGGVQRYSDDGEPGGTAGMPMMDVLKNEGIVNCCVAVVRYFGGVLLGTGGLVRAYTQGCKIALKAAGIVRMELTSIRKCRVSYPAWNMIQYAIRNLDVRLEDITYSDAVEFIVCTRKKDVQEMIRTMDTLTEGKTVWIKTEEKYMPWAV